MVRWLTTLLAVVKSVAQTKISSGMFSLNINVEISGEVDTINILNL